MSLRPGRVKQSGEQQFPGALCAISRVRSICPFVILIVFRSDESVSALDKLPEATGALILVFDLENYGIEGARIENLGECLNCTIANPRVIAAPESPNQRPRSQHCIKPKHAFEPDNRQRTGRIGLVASSAFLGD